MNTCISTLICLACLASSTYSFTQEIQLEIEGAIKIGDATTAPVPGTIRWTGTDFEGWDGEEWISLTIGTVYQEPVLDYDNNSYKTIKIGSQIWMAENLRVAHYQDGSPITNITDSTSWADTEEGAWCWYENDISYETTYGKLYNFHAVDTAIGLCPAGWHVPTLADIQDLFDFLNFITIEFPNTAGGQMKEQGFVHWNGPNYAATNASGFTGLPGGVRTIYSNFQNLGDYGWWWLSTGDDGMNADLMSLESTAPDLTFNEKIDQSSGLAVRCIQD